MVDSTVREIRLYVEGGGNQAETRAQFREGMSYFLRSLRDCARRKGIRWNVIACGGRASAYDDFCHALKGHPDSFNVLVVDAEGIVKDTPWRHLRWPKPLKATDEQCHLMVQTMESWIVADSDALSTFYAQNFNRNALPRRANIEEADRHALASALDRATNKTKKGTYQKIRHGAELLKRVDPAKVRAASSHCDRLFTTLENLMGC